MGSPMGCFQERPKGHSPIWSALTDPQLVCDPTSCWRKYWQMYTGGLQELGIFWTLADKMQAKSCLFMPEDIHPLFLLDPSPSPEAGRDDTAPWGHRTQRSRLHKRNRRNEEHQVSRLLILSRVQPSLSFVHTMLTNLQDVLPTLWKPRPSHGWYRFSLCLLWGTIIPELLWFYFFRARGPGCFKTKLTTKVCLHSKMQSPGDRPEPIQAVRYNLCLSRTFPPPQHFCRGPATRLLGKPSWGSGADGTPNSPL